MKNYFDASNPFDSLVISFFKFDVWFVRLSLGFGVDFPGFLVDYNYYFILYFYKYLSYNK